jgi:hypothetical protein
MSRLQSMELSLTIIVCELLLVIVTKANDDAYAQWIIPSQLNEAYKNAQHYSNSSSTTFIPAVKGQDHNSTTTTTMAVISSSLSTNSNKLQH